MEPCHLLKTNKQTNIICRTQTNHSSYSLSTAAHKYCAPCQIHWPVTMAPENKQTAANIHQVDNMIVLLDLVSQDIKTQS